MVSTAAYEALSREEASSLSHTDTKDRYLACEVADCVATDAGVGLGMTRTGTDDELRRFFCNELIQSNLVIPVDIDSSPF